MTSPQTAFTTASSAGLPGPDWLRARRAAAIARLDERSWAMPTTEAESWRYTPINELDLSTYGLAPATVSVTGATAEERDVESLAYPEPDGVTDLHDAFV